MSGPLYRSVKTGPITSAQLALQYFAGPGGGGVRGGPGHHLAVGPGAGRGGVAGLVLVRRGPKGASKLRRAGGADRRAGRRRAHAAADRRGDRGLDVHRPGRAGPGPAGRPGPAAGGEAPAAGGGAGQGSGQPARTPAPGRCAPVWRMAATSTPGRSATPGARRRPASRQLHHRASFHGFSCIQPSSGGAPVRSPGSIARGGTVASGSRSPRQRDGGVRGRGEQLPARRFGRHPPTVLPLPVGQRVPAITTSPNGMER